jgi:hypothetical protein
MILLFLLSLNLCNQIMWFGYACCLVALSFEFVVKQDMTTNECLNMLWKRAINKKNMTKGLICTVLNNLLLLL